MQHYFINKEHKESDFFEFQDEVIGLNLNFKSCDSIFSKNKIDDGTRTLLETIYDQMSLSGHCLDLGCGLGVIAISLMKKYDISFDMVDINETAVKLSKENLKKNSVDANVFVSDGFEKISNSYDYVITNPPIKTGKTKLFELLKGAYEHLNQNGELVLVIRKDHGMESTKKFLMETFKNAEILKRNKGYYILKSVKNT